MSKPTPWFIASLLLAGAAVAVFLSGCAALESVGDGISAALPATQGDVAAMGEALDGIERGAEQAINGVASGNTVETIAGSLLALLSSVSFVVGLSRRRRKDEILAAKTVKKVNALAPVVAEAIARQATASPASVPAADQTPTA